jgi:hypothetical protein
VAQGVLINTINGATQYSVSDTGSLVYVPVPTQGTKLRLVWVDLKGMEQPVDAPLHNYFMPRISPDGQRFLVLKAAGQVQASTRINVALNWSEELKRLASAGAK